jgi:hypothetical protein
VTEQQYAYPAPIPSSGRAATGRALLSASWSLLRQDRELIWLPTIGSLAGLAAAGILFVPGWLIGVGLGGSDHHSWGAWIGSVLAVYGATVVGIFFQAALVAGANLRADGGDPTLAGSIAAAWSRRGAILSWGLVATTVGLVVRSLEQRFGVVGKLVGLLAGLAWAIATFLVIPVVVTEDLSPVEAVKRSAHLIKTTWGTSVRTTVRFGLVQLAVIVPVVVLAMIGIGLLVSSSTPSQILGGVLLAVAIAGLLGAAMVFSAIGGYARALIYRYATGRPVPGVDAALFVGVFQPKK